MLSHLLTQGQAQLCAHWLAHTKRGWSRPICLETVKTPFAFLLPQLRRNTHLPYPARHKLLSSKWSLWRLIPIPGTFTPNISNQKGLLIIAVCDTGYWNLHFTRKERGLLLLLYSVCQSWLQLPANTILGDGEDLGLTSLIACPQMCPSELTGNLALALLASYPIRN